MLVGRAGLMVLDLLTGRLSSLYVLSCRRYLGLPHRRLLRLLLGLRLRGRKGRSHRSRSRLLLLLRG